MREIPVTTAGSTARWVGVDVGGTKTHVVAVTDVGRSEMVVPSAQWRHGPLFSDPGNLDRLALLVREAARVDAETVAVFGVHGCDSPAQVDHATRVLGDRLSGTVHVANDAELLGWAAGENDCLKMIVGTGAVVIGRTADGDPVTASGYGWLLGDDGSAPGLVGAALRELLRRHDEGRAVGDPLFGAMMDAFGAEDVTTLALTASANAGLLGWGAHGRTIFDAAERGSDIARTVIAESGRRLAANVHAVSQRGAVGGTVVAAGSVIVHQPLLQAEIRAGLRLLGSDLRLRVLTDPPAEGALAWARHLAAARETAAL